MDILTFSEQLQSQMKEQINTVSSEQPEILASTARIMTVIKESIHELQQFVYNYKFQDQAEEIRFFKEVKPVFVSQYIYYNRIFAIRLFDSYKDAEGRKAYYHKILKRLELYAKRNNEFYLYCMTNATYFDDKYFTRKGKAFTELIDERFSTGYDEKLAKILANEMVKTYLHDAIRRLVSGQDSALPSLPWTGSKTDLIELIYALHSAGVFEADIKQIAQLFEELFKINLGNYYDTIKKIRLRKSGQANFLDLMKDKFLTRLESMEE